jgi:hypothetical protein
MTNSRIHTPSVAYRESPDLAWNPTRDPQRIRRFMPHIYRLLRTPARNAPDRDVGRGR